MHHIVKFFNFFVGIILTSPILVGYALAQKHTGAPDSDAFAAPAIVLMLWLTYLFHKGVVLPEEQRREDRQTKNKMDIYGGMVVRTLLSSVVFGVIIYAVYRVIL